MFHGKLPQHAYCTPTCARVRARTRGHGLMTHPVNPRSFGMKFIALVHVTTYTRPPFYSLGGLGTRLEDACHLSVQSLHKEDASHPSSTAEGTSYQLMDKHLVDYSLSSEEECNGEKEQN